MRYKTFAPNVSPMISCNHFVTDGLTMVMLEMNDNIMRNIGVEVAMSILLINGVCTKY